MPDKKRMVNEALLFLKYFFKLFKRLVLRLIAVLLYPLKLPINCHIINMKNTSLIKQLDRNVRLLHTRKFSQICMSIICLFSSSLFPASLQLLHTPYQKGASHHKSYPLIQEDRDIHHFRDEKECQ